MTDHTSQPQFSSQSSSPSPSQPQFPSQSSSPSPSQPQPQAFPFQRLHVYVAARDLAALVHTARIADDELRDQATRAAKSCFLALAEGLPHESPGQRRRYFETAHASLCECVAALDLAAAIGAVAPERAGAAQALALQVKRMLFALRRPTARAA